MPRKILYESAVHQFLAAGSRLQHALRPGAADRADRLAHWIGGLELDHPNSGQLRVRWSEPRMGEQVIEFKPAKLYQRGDTALHQREQLERGLVFAEDR